MRRTTAAPCYVARPCDVVGKCRRHSADSGKLLVFQSKLSENDSKKTRLQQTRKSTSRGSPPRSDFQTIRDFGAPENRGFRQQIDAKMQSDLAFILASIIERFWADFGSQNRPKIEQNVV